MRSGPSGAEVVVPNGGPLPHLLPVLTVVLNINPHTPSGNGFRSRQGGGESPPRDQTGLPELALLPSQAHSPGQTSWGPQGPWFTHLKSGLTAHLAGCCTRPEVGRHGSGREAVGVLATCRGVPGVWVRDEQSASLSRRTELHIQRGLGCPNDSAMTVARLSGLRDSR